MLNDDQMKRIEEAKRQVVDGSLTLWNARLEVLVRAGDIRGVLEQMRKAAEDANNCNCNTFCKPAIMDPGEIVTQPSVSNKMG